MRVMRKNRDRIEDPVVPTVIRRLLPKEREAR